MVGTLQVMRIDGAVVVRIAETSSVSEESLEKPTPRETEVLALVAEGYSNKIIGSRLGIAEATVKNHLWRTMEKLGARDRTHAVITAVRKGWLII